MPDKSDAKLLQVLRRQTRQDRLACACGHAQCLRIALTGGVRLTICGVSLSVFSFATFLISRLSRRCAVPIFRRTSAVSPPTRDILSLPLPCPFPPPPPPRAPPD